MGENDGIVAGQVAVPIPVSKSSCPRRSYIREYVVESTVGCMGWH